MLSQGEQNVLAMFEHFNCVEGGFLPLGSIGAVQRKYLNPVDQNNIGNLFNALIQKNYIKEGESGFILCRNGEVELWGEYEEDGAIHETLSIFKHFSLTKDQCLTVQVFFHNKEKFLSPLNLKSENQIKTTRAGIDQGFWKESENGLVLTLKGESAIY